MHFNPLGTSMTFSDTPLRSFLNESHVLTPELSQGEKQQTNKKNPLLLTFASNDDYTQGTLCYLKTKK